MKRLIFAFCILLATGQLMAAGGEDSPNEPANIDPNNRQSQQRGARLFINYCLSCHSAELMRYERIGKDLGINDKMLEENLVFTGGKVTDLMTVATADADAKAWFGTVPPDLTVIARSRGADWLYNFLHSFYRDGSKITGVNNLVFPDVGMPHVLWELQGWQEPVITTVKDEKGREHKDVALELVEPGLMSPKEYDRAIRDLVNFLDYMGEPYKYERQHLGIKVIMFLIVLLVLAFLMKKDFWKDVH